MANDDVIITLMEAEFFNNIGGRVRSVGVGYVRRPGG